jgi:vacuolar protein sorting-associated protein VTA1
MLRYRATAKKFLAAANFLEVLKIFPKSESLDSVRRRQSLTIPDSPCEYTSPQNEEKIRYAKWKAADIAKSLREGRQPLPGPAIPEIAENAETETPVFPNLTPPHSPGMVYSMPTPPEVPSPPAFTRHIPPPLSGVSDMPEPQTPPQSAHLGVWGQVNTPGTWSTVATPGTAQPHSDADDWRSRDDWMNSPTPDSFVPHEVDDLSLTASRRSAGRMPRSASVSPKSTGAYERPYSPVSPGMATKGTFPVPTSRHALETDFGSENAIERPRLAAAQPTDLPVDLTPSVIAKAQKHARFAISALDYEDHEQAKKELRTALAILGGQ